MSTSLFYQIATEDGSRRKSSPALRMPVTAVIAAAFCRRALVTGATGFIGSNLLRHLSGSGWEVAALARPAASVTLAGESAVARVYRYTGRTEEVIEALSDFRPTIVFHLASVSLSSHSSEQVEPLIAGNVLYGAQLLEAMAKANITTLVNAGTSWQNYKGDDYDPVNLYAATKQAFEDILRYYVQSAGIGAVTLRLYDCYGLGDRRGKVVQLMLQCLKTGKPLGMSPGDQVIDLVHVDDTCRAFMCAAEIAQQQCGSSVFSVGGERLTLRQLAATLEQAAGRKLPVKFGERPYRVREVMRPWIGTALPGWQPEIGLLEGLRLLIEAEPA